jgi:hypothetical protein
LDVLLTTVTEDASITTGRRRDNRLVVHFLLKLDAIKLAPVIVAVINCAMLGTLLHEGSQQADGVVTG